MSNPTDDAISITVTVDTDNITESNKDCSVVFSEGLGGPIQDPCAPANFLTEVEKNQVITWTAVPKNGGSTVVFFQNVKREGGKSILKDFKRGRAHNVYTAKIRNDNSLKKDDQENYSITIGLNGYEGMAGSNENGPIVYLGKTVAYMNSYAENVWHTVAEAPFEIEGIAGHNTDGPIIFSGNRVAYMNGYGSNTWTELPSAPFTIEGIAGNNNVKGVLAYSGNRVAYLHYSAQSTWVEVNNAPFDIEGITGDYYGGPIVFAENQIANMGNYKANTWQVIQAPFDVEGISGSRTNGLVIYAGSQVAYITSYNAGAWTQVSETPFIIEGISGNGTRGPIVFSGPQVKYMSDYRSNQWHDVASMPFSTRSFTIDPRLKMKDN